MSTRKKLATQPTELATPPKAPRTRTRRPFLESQLHCGRALKAFAEMGGVDYSVEVFRFHYEAQSNRRRAFKNDPAALRQRLAELEGAVKVPVIVERDLERDPLDQLEAAS